MAEGRPTARYRAFYPEIRLTTRSYATVDAGSPSGHVTEPGVMPRTVTRPDLFRPLFRAADRPPDPKPRHRGGDRRVKRPLCRCNFRRGQRCGQSTGAQEGACGNFHPAGFLSTCRTSPAPMTYIVQTGLDFFYEDGAAPLAPFTAQRVDYSLARLSHYTATDAAHFQNHVLFTIKLTSSTWTSSRPMPAPPSPIPRRATRSSSPPETPRSPRPTACCRCP